MSNKICSKCKRELPISEFRWKNKAKGLTHSQCKECQKAQEKIHYQESKERRESVRETADLQKANNLGIIDTIKSNGCKKCGDKRLYVLDFHHRDPSQKEGTINHMIKSAGYAKLMDEIQKCDILCANCHREFHYLEREIGISYDEYILGTVAYTVGAPV